MIKIVKNILTNKERKQLIKYSKPLLLTGEQLNLRKGPLEYPPSKQTLANLHKNDKFKPVIRKLLHRIAIEMGPGLELVTDKIWVNWNSGKKEEQCWHTHVSEYALVYYIRTVPFFNSGTQFKHKFVRAPQNSLMIFSGDMEHTVPSYPFYFGRYTLSMEINIIR